MSRNDLQDELQAARRSLHILRRQLAMYGISAPPHMTMQAEEAEQHIARLERALGLPATEPRILPDAPLPQTHYTPPIPDHVFQERIMSEQQRQRQRNIEHQLTLLGIHRRHLAILRNQARQLGAYAPTYITAQIAERIGEIARVKATLRAESVAVADLPGDE